MKIAAKTVSIAFLMCLFSGIAHAQVFGKFYDSKYTPNVAEACEIGSDSIVTFGNNEIDFSESTCKIRKVERWPRSNTQFTYSVACSDGRRNELIIEQETSDRVWVQWSKGPLADTSGVVYRRCPQK